MWISEFARQAGTSVDTVRFYVRQGLLKPAAGRHGTTHRYQEFSEEDVRLVGSIRVGQALGLSLREIKLLLEQRRSGAPAGAGALRALHDVRDRLRVRSAELAAMHAFVDAKIAWLEAPQRGERPVLADFLEVPLGRRPVQNS